MDDVSTITGVIDPDILNSVSDGLLQQLWEGGLLPECVSGAKALRELNKWLGHHETIGRVAHDGGANLVRRINACRAQLVLLERHAASNTQSTTHRAGRKRAKPAEESAAAGGSGAGTAGVVRRSRMGHASIGILHGGSPGAGQQVASSEQHMAGAATEAALDEDSAGGHLLDPGLDKPASAAEAAAFAAALRESRQMWEDDKKRREEQQVKEMLEQGGSAGWGNTRLRRLRQEPGAAAGAAAAGAAAAGAAAEVKKELLDALGPAANKPDGASEAAALAAVKLENDEQHQREQLELADDPGWGSKPSKRLRQGPGAAAGSAGAGGAGGVMLAHMGQAPPGIVQGSSPGAGQQVPPAANTAAAATAVPAAGAAAAGVAAPAALGAAAVQVAPVAAQAAAPAHPQQAPWAAGAMVQQGATPAGAPGPAVAQQPAGPAEAAAAGPAAAGPADAAAANSTSLAATMAALRAAVPDDASARKLMFMALLKDVMDKL